MRNVIKAVGYTNTKSSIYKSTICRTRSITSLYYRDKFVRPSIHSQLFDGLLDEAMEEIVNNAWQNLFESSPSYY